MKKFDIRCRYNSIPLHSTLFLILGLPQSSGWQWLMVHSVKIASDENLATILICNIALYTQYLHQNSLFYQRLSTAYKMDLRRKLPSRFLKKSLHNQFHKKVSVPTFYTLFVFSLDPDHKSMLILHQKSWLLQFLYRKAPIRGLDLQPLLLHSPSKCLAWVKKCCHVWLDQNFDPSLLTNKLWLVFIGKKN